MRHANKLSACYLSPVGAVAPSSQPGPRPPIWKAGRVGGLLFLLSASALLMTTGPLFPEALSEAEPVSSVPLSNQLNASKVHLGRALFSDTRLSGNNGISCASCHRPDQGFTDGKPAAHSLVPLDKLPNTPTLLNIGLNAMFNWNGRVPDLQEQVIGVVENRRAMGGKWDQIIPRLEEDHRLSKSFDAIYEDGITSTNVANAIAEYEKSLLTPNAPLDRFLRGDQTALSEEARNGYDLFKSYGCISCHQGVNVGGNMLQVFGIFGRPPTVNMDVTGSAENTGIADVGPVFRVPGLRNVEKTAPYFHDGSAATLPEAIETMATYQLGRRISREDITKIEAFLKSLSGEYDDSGISER